MLWENVDRMEVQKKKNVKAQEKWKQIAMAGKNLFFIFMFIQ